MFGKIVFVRPCLKRGRLLARVTVQTERHGYYQALLPERELAALVPRSLLVCDRGEAPHTLLGIIGSLLQRTASGRKVRLHRSPAGESLVTFLPWKPVRFHQPDPPSHPDRRASFKRSAPPLHENAEGDRHIEGTFGAGQGDGNPSQAAIGQRQGLGTQAELLRTDEHDA
jgi:hypothetical protein